MNFFYLNLKLTWVVNIYHYKCLINLCIYVFHLFVYLIKDISCIILCQRTIKIIICWNATLIICKPVITLGFSWAYWLWKEYSSLKMTLLGTIRQLSAVHVDCSRQIPGTNVNKATNQLLSDHRAHGSIFDPC